MAEPSHRQRRGSCWVKPRGPGGRHAHLKQESSAGISFFQKYLTAWVFLRMVAGILLGHFAPAFPELLARFEYARISIPMAILIWVTICPMILKVDFQSIRNVRNSPKGLLVTWIVNWLIKLFTMYGIASRFFVVLFKGFNSCVNCDVLFCTSTQAMP